MPAAAWQAHSSCVTAPTTPSLQMHSHTHAALRTCAAS